MMKLLFRSCLTIFTLAIITASLAGSSLAARLHHLPHMRHQDQQEESAAPQKTEIRELGNKFFSISLPEGWKLQRPVPNVADRVSAVFMKGGQIRIALNVFKSPFTAELLAKNISQNMRKRGMEVSEPVEKNGLYVVNISKKDVSGKGFFGSDGSTSASTIIFAPELSEADELLKALKPEVSGIIPQSVE